MPRPEPRLAAQAPLLPFTLLLIAGIAAQALSGGWLCAAIFSGGSVAAFALLWARGRAYGAVSALAPAIGAWLAWCAMPQSAAIITDNAVWTAEVLETSPSTKGLQAVVRVDSLIPPASTRSVAVRPFKVRLGISGQTSGITTGSELVFPAKLTPPEDRRSHPLETDHNLRHIRSGIALSGFIDADSIRSVSPPHGLRPRLRSFADDVNRLIAFSPALPSTQGLLSAMLTGHRDWLTPSVRDLYSTAGIAHILALSGMHVAVLTFLCGILTLPLMLCGHRKWAMAATLCVLWIFAVATGLSVSVVRAAIMASLMLVALMADRRPTPVNAVCAAAVVVLSANPLQLFSVSFQLSFAAVVSIIMLYPAMSRMLPERPLLRYPLQFCAVSMAAVAGTGIICAYHFGTFQPYFLLSNIIASFLLPWFMGAGILMLLLEAVGIASWPVALALDFIAGAIDAGARLTASLPGSPIVLSGVSLWCVAAYFAVLLFLFAAARTRRAAYAIAASLTAIAGIALWVITSPGSGVAAIPFAERSEPHFTLVHSDGDTLRILTAAPAAEHRRIEAELAERHTSLMAATGASTVRATGLVHGDTIGLGGRRLLYIEHPLPSGQARGERVDFLVIGARFRGDLSQTAAVAAETTDTVVISAGLNTSRAAALVRRLSKAGIPHINLRHRPLLLTQ